LSSLLWLEEFLRKFAGVVVVISHDRVFLDNIVNRIIEIDNGKANFYSGNYTFYAEERERRFQTQAEQYRQQQRKIDHLETAAKRLRVWGRAADNAALHKRAYAIEKRVEKMDKIDKPKRARRITKNFGESIHAAKVLVAFDSVTKSFGENILMSDVSLKIRKNDRIALIGANGCGKTTLLKMILGQEKCDNDIEEAVKISENAKTAYLPQIIDFENPEATIIETFRDEMGESVATDERARSILAGFHFRANDITKKVGKLSGGEKSRLKLCLLMQSNINLLILDEPTNHLDIESREWIEQALEKFDGAIIFVSHDRYFLNKFAESIWIMENSKIDIWDDCTFDEYLEISKD